jgi:hypothetical protein
MMTIKASRPKKYSMKILPFAGSQIVLDYAGVASKIGYWREHLPHFTLSNAATLDRVTKSVA